MNTRTKSVNLQSLFDRMTLPAIAAPMFLVSGIELVVDTCKSGVIGTFPLFNARTTEALEEWLQTISENMEKLSAADPARKIAPWGVNMNVHKSNERFEPDLELVKRYKVPIVITSLGNPARVVEEVHQYGGLVFSDVIGIKHAKKAADAGVDGLILVCNGAGGHGGTLNPIAFINEVKQFWDGITILAGCISHGRDIAAAEALGADLAYIGTRFIAAEESLAGEDYKSMLIGATIDDILYTDAISGVNANFLIPSLRNVGLDPDNLPKKDSVDVVHKDRPKAWKNIWSAGQGVGSVKKVQPVAEIVAELKEQYMRTVTELAENRQRWM